MEKQCRNCAFCFVTEGKGLSVCRRYAPAPRVKMASEVAEPGPEVTLGGHAIWPIVKPQWWCGEWQSK